MQLPEEVKKINQFIVKPKEFLEPSLSSKEKIQVFLNAFFYHAAITYPIILPLILFIDQFVLTLEEVDLEWGPMKIILAMVVIAPLFEELIFRLPLRHKWNWLWRVTEFIFRLTPGQLWTQIYPYIIYVFAIIFALVHLTNYENTGIVFLLIAPVLVSSQFLGGLIMSYIRLKLGFWWGVAFHSLWNAIAAAVFFLGELL